MKSIIEKIIAQKDSLAFSQFIWFLFISVTPLLIFVGYSYFDGIKQLENTSKLQLYNSSFEQKKYIENWFKYRRSDISYWSQTKNSIDFFTDLNKEYKQVQEMKVFLESYNYATVVSKYDNDLRMLKKQYDYIYDFFLIDLEGNIIYTLRQEDDLGTNLFDGEYSSSRFAQAFKKTVLTGGIYFSDLEFYLPSTNQVAGFFTAPLIDNNGDFIGVFAFQIKSEHINESLADNKEGAKHYLVGSDGLLRSDFSSTKKSLLYDVKNQKVELWKKSYVGNSEVNHSKEFRNYLNPINNKVLGNHAHIEILGIHWALVSEYKHKTIYADKEELIKTLLFYLAIIIAVIMVMAVYVAKKITKPIRNLANISNQFSEGERNVLTVNHDKGEVGQLANAFNKMIISLKNKEMSLEEKTDKLELVLNQLDKNVIITKTNLRGDITYASEAFCSLSGYTRGELMGKSHSIVRHPDVSSDTFKDLWQTLKSEACWAGELKNRKKDGSDFWLYKRIEPEYNKKGRVISYSAIGYDITMSKHYELNLQELVDIKTLEIKKQTDILFQQSRMAQMGEMISMIAHQWRQPLSAISSTSIDLSMQMELETFDLEQDKGREECQAYFAESLNDIAKFVKSLTSTIDDFRNFYKPDKKADFILLSEPTTKALNIIKASLSSSNIEVIQESHCNQKVNIYTNEIMQVILNILRNAQDNFKEQDIKNAKINLACRCSDNDKKIVLEICDNGGGIPEEILPKIFDPYFSTKDEKNGTGLGLYMSKTIIEEHHHGSLHVENRDDGVCFSIVLNKES